MENLLTFSAVRVHSDVGKDVFSFDSRSFGCSGWGDICLWSNSSCRDASLWAAGICFFPFLAHMPLHSQKRNTLISLSLRQSHTDYMCSSSLNDTVNAPHQRMSHSTTLLLWWFLHSVYYIMQQRVLLSYIHHNKHSSNVLIWIVSTLHGKYNQNHYPSIGFFTPKKKGGCFYKEQKADACQRVPEVPPWVKGWALHTYFTLTWILHAIGAAFRTSHATVKFIANPIQINSSVHLTWPLNSVSAGEYDRHSRCSRILHLAAANWSLVL